MVSKPVPDSQSVCLDGADCFLHETAPDRALALAIRGPRGAWACTTSEQKGKDVMRNDPEYLLRWDAADDGWGQITAVLPDRWRPRVFLGFVPLDSLRADLYEGMLTDGMMQLRLDGQLRARLLHYLADHVGLLTDSAVLS